MISPAGGFIFQICILLTEVENLLRGAVVSGGQHLVPCSLPSSFQIWGWVFNKNLTILTNVISEVVSLIHLASSDV